MVTIEIEDLPNSFFSKVTIKLTANRTEELYLPKQLADQITMITSRDITARSNTKRTISGA